MPATVQNLVIEQGATFSRVVTCTTAAGAVFTLTGYVARMKLRPTPGHATVLLSLTSSPAAGLVVDGTLGTITITITAAQTAAMTFSEASYDLEVESAGGVVTRVLQGIVELSVEVTR